jgi:hypothetical protein
MLALYAFESDSSPISARGCWEASVVLTSAMQVMCDSYS